MVAPMLCLITVMESSWFGEQLANPVGVFFRIGVANKSEVAVFSMGLLVEGGQLLQAFLATMRCSCQRKLAIGVEIQQRLQIKLGARKSNRSGDAATTMQGIEVINHEQGLYEIACFFRPGNHFFGGKPAFALTQSLQHQQTFRSRTDKKINDIDRRFRVFGLQLAPNGISRAVVAGKPGWKNRGIPWERPIQ